MKQRVMLLLLAIVVGLVVTGGVAYAATFTCDDVGDQDPNPGQCLGTEDADLIGGTANSETISALAGNDRVLAYAGDDQIRGFAGNDEIWGDEGNDTTDGYEGNDIIRGGPNGDGSAQSTDWGPDTQLEGGEDNDKVYGGGGPDYIDASANDVASDVSDPALLVDRSFGGGGNDHIYAVDGNKDIIDCGLGSRDEAEFDAGIDTTKNCEQTTAVIPSA